MAKEKVVRARVKKEVKEEAEEILESLGISTSSAIDIYLHKIIECNGIPFDLKLPKIDEGC